MTADQSAPAMVTLHRRLLAAPLPLLQGPLEITALAHDLIFQFDSAFNASLLTRFDQLTKSQASLAGLLIWLLADTTFSRVRLSASDLAQAIGTVSIRDDQQIDLAGILADEDLREELIRLLLSALCLCPEGETAAQAEDRLLMVSAAERDRVLAASRAAEQRAAAIREALAEQRAREAADKYTRE
ncbi:MAG: hypothetical protein LAT63_09395 [Marinobacter sp.]|nr:hypothetical protein [Marinobacter sp.]